MLRKSMYLFGLLTIVCGQNGLAQKNKKQQPNIIYIMSDDHTSQAVGAYGGRLAGLNPTPNIDKLAKDGMLFENTFCTNSICTPSRPTTATGCTLSTIGYPPISVLGQRNTN